MVFRKAGKVRNWFRASFSPFLKRTTLETPCSSPLLIVFVCKLFNLTEVTRSNGGLEQSFPFSCVVILNQVHVRSVVKKQLTDKGSYLSKSTDGCSKRASDFSMPGYQLKPSDGKKKS